MPAQSDSQAMRMLPEQLVELVREQIGAALPPRLAAGRERLLAHVPHGGRRRRRAAWFVLPTLATAGMILFVQTRPAALSYEVTEGGLAAGELVAHSTKTHVRFSDASEIALDPGSSGRLEHVAAEGARLRLRSGRALVDITARPKARWAVAAGPFTIDVRGTRFSVAWSDADQRLDVRLDRGAVEITGPLVTGIVGLRPGQRFVADLPAREVHVLAADEALEPAEQPAAAAPVSRERTVAIAHAPRVKHAARTKPRPVTKVATAALRPTFGWPDKLRAGAFREIVDEAEKQDVRDVLARAPLDDVAALADAARYQRRTTLAGRALEALRDRDPRSEAARDAAFHLGRIEESTHGPTAKALSWYERYAAEAPRGAYAAEALARRIGVAEKLGGAATARPLADEYLRRFPNGAFADGARALATPIR